MHVFRWKYNRETPCLPVWLPRWNSGRFVHRWDDPMFFFFLSLLFFLKQQKVINGTNLRLCNPLLLWYLIKCGMMLLSRSKSEQLSKCWHLTLFTVTLAGIGYFTLPYLVHAKAQHVHACEWNPDAVRALQKNLVTNGVSEHCTVHPGDNRKVTELSSVSLLTLNVSPICITTILNWVVAPSSGW